MTRKNLDYYYIVRKVLCIVKHTGLSRIYETFQLVDILTVFVKNV